MSAVYVKLCHTAAGMNWFLHVYLFLHKYIHIHVTKQPSLMVICKFHWIITQN